MTENIPLCKAADTRPAVGHCIRAENHRGDHEGWHAGGYRTTWKSDKEAGVFYDDVSLKTADTYFAASPPDSNEWTQTEHEVYLEPGVPLYGSVPVTFQSVFRGIFDEAFDLLVERQSKYGPTNIAQQGFFGVFTRLSDDKVERVRRALNGKVFHGKVELDLDSDFDDESLEDALLDIANYSLILIALKRGVWGAPLEDE